MDEKKNRKMEKYNKLPCMGGNCENRTLTVLLYCSYSQVDMQQYIALIYNARNSGFVHIFYLNYYKHAVRRRGARPVLDLY